MKNRGFTLVEILGVIVVLSLLVVGTYTVVDGIARRNTKTLYKAQVSEIIDGAVNFASNTKGVHLPDKPMGTGGCQSVEIKGSSIPDYNRENIYKIKIYLDAIVNEGILDENIKNPVKDKNIDIANSYVTVTYEEYDGTTKKAGDMEKYNGNNKYTYTEVLKND